MIFMPSIGLADTALIESPAKWRLQAVSGGGVIVFFASTSCSQGLLGFDSTATSDDKNRFWSLVLTAKSTGSTVGVFYNNSSGSCIITSFFAPP
jgi:hypothetical protein